MFTLCVCTYTGIIVGAVIRYAIPVETRKEFVLTTTSPQQSVGSEGCEKLSADSILNVGEVVVLVTLRDNFTCSVDGKLFRTRDGNFIQQTVSAFNCLTVVLNMCNRLCVTCIELTVLILYLFTAAV